MKTQPTHRRKSKKPDDTARWAWELTKAAKSMPELFEEKSDRACVIVAAALIDSAIEMKLRHFFIATSGATELDCDWLLTEGRSPLLSMTVRMKLAKALGLITDPIRNSIEKVVRIRNDFAHEPSARPLSAEESNILEGCVTDDKLRRRLHEILKSAGGDVNPRNVFSSQCVILHLLLVKEADDEWGDDIAGERS